jgi:hypothetical protein
LNSVRSSAREGRIYFDYRFPTSRSTAKLKNQP